MSTKAICAGLILRKKASGYHDACALPYKDVPTGLGELSNKNFYHKVVPMGLQRRVPSEWNFGLRNEDFRRGNEHQQGNSFAL